MCDHEKVVIHEYQNVCTDCGLVMSVLPYEMVSTFDHYSRTRYTPKKIQTGVPRFMNNPLLETKVEDAYVRAFGKKIFRGRTRVLIYNILADIIEGRDDRRKWIKEFESAGKTPATSGLKDGLRRQIDDLF